MNTETKTSMGRKSKLDRFNRDPEKTNFFDDFQNVMIERLSLNRMGMYHPDNVDQIIKDITGKPPISINASISGGFLLSCSIEPEMYIIIQDIMKKLTGKYTSMDELIHLLLSYFVFTYRDLPKAKNVFPFKRVKPGRALKKLHRFHYLFRKYYSNTVVFEEA
jgi:hypothetical protein